MEAQGLRDLAPAPAGGEEASRCHMMRAQSRGRASHFSLFFSLLYPSVPAPRMEA
jgi:hypothetical protein